jgi:hypothetical protein
MKKTNTLVFSNRVCFLAFAKTPVLPRFLKKILPMAALVLLLLGGNHRTLAQCSMICDNLVSLSLPATCEAEVIYTTILEGANGCVPSGPSAFQVTVMDNTGAVIPTSPIITKDYIGKTLTAKVKHIASGNSCWGNIMVEDKLPPQLTCPPDVTVACTASTSPNNTGAPTVSDCSSYTLNHFDNVVNNGCGGTYAGIITRTWTATDFYGNSKNCNQIIRIELPGTLSIQWPGNKDGITGAALDCLNPDTNPSNTGFPTIAGAPIPNGVGFCNMAVTYNDQVLNICQGSYKILRKWTIVFWCTGSIFTHTQIIAVKDSKAPVLACPPAFTAGTTSSNTCKASVLLPTVGISDDCSTTFTTTMNTPAGLINGNGGLIHNVSPGTYTIQYNVTDNCGNTANCATSLTVVDDDAPIVVCDAVTVVSLNNLGMAVVFASTFDDGSYDNCGNITLTARRMQAGCGTLPDFASTVKFCCADVGNTVMVQMKATDQAGNSNTCMVSAQVTENSAPAILCPPNKTVACTTDWNDLSLTGQPTVSVACGLDTITYTDVENLNMCKIGTISRKWKATSSSGLSSTCTQTITTVDNTPVSVTFPPDYTAPACTAIADLAPTSLPAPYNKPVVTGNDCELIATNFTDQVFTVAAPACFKIVRTWTLINWCVYDPNSGSNAGKWQAQQIIKVIDNQKPVITCPNNLTVGVGTDCKATVNLPPLTNIQDCSQNVGVSVSSFFGSGLGPFPNVLPGNYTATYVVSDGCNNSSNCTINVTVKDTVKPTVYCEFGLVIELAGADTDGDGIVDDGEAVVWANDFNKNSFDNCPGALKFSFSADVQNNSLTLTCADEGQVPIEMWVTDASGNKDFCKTHLVVQDNMGVCSGTLFASVGGAVTNEMGYNLEDVKVTVSDSSNIFAMTGPDGNFSFAALPLGDDFTVTPAKDTNLLNGVSTFDLVLIRKHILNVEHLPSPYKIIAADVNHSNTVTTADLVALQKAILLVTDTFPGNKSWRFIDAAYVFPDPANPFAAPFPEVYNINNLTGAMLDVNFIGIKIGDVNNSAAPNQFAAPAEERSSDDLTLFTADAELRPGETYRLDVAAGNFRDVSGYQFTLQFDPEALEFTTLEPSPATSLSAANFGFRFLEEGFITTSWSDAKGNTLPGDALLFSLVFKAKTKTIVSRAISLGSRYTPAEAYRPTGEISGVLLQFHRQAGGGAANASAHPNPFKTSTVIGFYLPESQEVTLSVFDLSGREVKTERGSYTAGAHEWRVRAADLPGAGNYFYRLKLAKEVLTGKLILMN